MSPASDVQAPRPVIETERSYQGIFEAAGDGLLIIAGETGEVVEANPAASALYGYTREEFLGRPLKTFVHPDSYQVFADYLQAVQARGVFETRMVHLRRDGAVFHIEAHGTAFTYQGQPCLLNVVRDVSERVHAEQRLQQEVEAHALEQSTLATLHERQRLAQELHDAVNQSLFSAGLIAEVLPRLWERDPQAGRQSLEDLRQLTRGALAEMRLLLAELRPSALTDAELGELLRLLGNALAGRTNIPIAVTVSGQGSLPAEVQIGLYRLCQEALNNIAKHAGAKHVTIQLRQTAAEVNLTIRDDGHGFDPEHIPSGHYGLSIMRERADSIGAVLRATSRPGQGTEIVIRWSKTQELEAR